MLMFAAKPRDGHEAATVDVGNNQRRGFNRGASRSARLSVVREFRRRRRHELRILDLGTVYGHDDGKRRLLCAKQSV